MIRFFKGPTWADRRIVAFDRGEPGDRYKCLAVVRQRGLGVILFNAVFVGFMVEDKEFLDGQCYAHERRGEWTPEERLDSGRCPTCARELRLRTETTERLAHWKRKAERDAEYLRVMEPLLEEARVAFDVLNSVHAIPEHAHLAKLRNRIDESLKAKGAPNATD